MMGPDIGAACSSDNDCGAGLRCITPASDSTFLGGGAVGGYCTMDCATDGDCGGVNRCLDGECWEGCFIGQPPGQFIDDPLDPMKCHGREDVRCSPAGDGGGQVCIPTCGADSQCGGRYCDHRGGACVDQQPTGTADGPYCDNDAPDEDGCLGVCQSFDDGDPNTPNWAICASTCVLDGDLTVTDDCGGIDQGLCIFKPSANGPGDWGRCTITCDAHDDCANPNLFCRSTSYSPTGMGYCLFPTECPTGTECAALSPPSNTDYQYSCEPTPYGDYCLEVDTTCSAGGSGGTGGTGGSGGSGGGGTGGAGGGAGNPCLVFPLQGN